MVQKFNAFLNSHKVSSHAIAVAIVGFLGLYTGDKQFADWLNPIVAQVPGLAKWLTGAALIYLRYSSSQKAVTQ